MYISRYHFENDKISLSLDSKSGELIELINKTTGDNLIKSHEYSCPPPFCLCLADGATVTAPRRKDCMTDTSLAAKIVCVECDGKKLIQVSYNKLIDNHGRKYDTSLSYTIKLTDGSGVIDMDMKLEKGSEMLSSVLFPYVAGIWLGESYDDDVLVYPMHGGIKMNSPIRSMSAPPNRINWRWQEYRYVYNLTGLGLWADGNGYYNLDNKYSGPLSMAYLDMYDENGGIYVGYPDEPDHTISLLAQTKGEVCAGMNFAVRHTITETIPELFFRGQIMLHKGDWHTAADYYRSISRSGKRSCPKWFDESAGLAAHYDFKYQNGGVVHRFTDIPRLVDDALSIGLDHLLISGWHKDGFDNGFPQYYCDEEVGTFEELSDGLKYAKDHGVKVSFYINSRLANTKYEANKELIEKGCIRRKDGSPDIEQYGDETITFATMCAASKEWQSHLGGAFEYVKKAGADGIYFDQIGMAPPLLCYSKEHDHRIDEWIAGCRKLIKDARETGLNVIIEGCSDLYGDMVGGQLISTFAYIDVAFPSLYRYTYPDQTLVDMVYPKHNLAMRPVFVANKAKQMIDTAILNGLYIWAYDLEYDNTFFRDPKTLEYLCGALNIRKNFGKLEGEKRFIDTNGIISIENGRATLFEYDEGLVLFASDCDKVTVSGRYNCISAKRIVEKNTLSDSGYHSAIVGNSTEVEMKSTKLGMFVLEKYEE